MKYISNQIIGQNKNSKNIFKLSLLSLCILGSVTTNFVQAKENSEIKNKSLTDKATEAFVFTGQKIQGFFNYISSHFNQDHDDDLIIPIYVTENGNDKIIENQEDELTTTNNIINAIDKGHSFSDGKHHGKLYLGASLSIQPEENENNLTVNYIQSDQQHSKGVFKFGLNKDLTGLTSLNFKNNQVTLNTTGLRVGSNIGSHTLMNNTGFFIQSNNGEKISIEAGRSFENTLPAVKFGNNNSKVILTNIHNGSIAKNSTDAITGGQLFDLIENLKIKYKITNNKDNDIPEEPIFAEMPMVNPPIINAMVLRDTPDPVAEKVEGDEISTAHVLTYNGNNNIELSDDKAGNIDISLKDHLTNLASVETSSGSNKVKLEGDNLTFSIGNKKVILTGTNNGLSMNNNKISKLTGGDLSATSSEAINGKQIYELVGEKAINSNGHVEKIGGTNANNIDGAIRELKTEIANNKVEIVGDNNIKIEPTGAKNNSFKVSLNENPNFKTIQLNGDDNATATISVTKDQQGSNLNVNGAKITNVRAGVEDNDVATVGQIKTAVKDLATASQVKAVINDVQEVKTAVQDLEDEDRNLRAGIAGALATAGLQPATEAGSTRFSIGAGSYGGQNAVAFGVSTLSDNGKFGVRLTGMTTSRGNSGGSVSFGWGFSS